MVAQNNVKEKEEKKEKLYQGHTYLQWIFALLANSTHFVYGMEMGWISATSKKLQAESSPAGYPLTDGEVAWIASVMSISATCVVVIHSCIADRYGRKFSVMLIATLEAISWIVRAFFTSYTSLLIARVLAGLSAGGAYNVVPMYVKEISRDDIRGTLCTTSIILQTTGLFIMYLIGAYLDYMTVIYIVMGLPIVTILGMIAAPESPEFLVKQDKIDKAIETVAYVRGLDKNDNIVQTVVETMSQKAAQVKSLPDINIISILKNKVWRRGFLIMIIAFTCFEVNGGFAIITYASIVIASTGVEFPISPELQSLAFPVVMMIGSLALASSIERYGRKPLLIGTYVISAIGMFSIAAIIIVQQKIGGVPGWLPLVIMMVIVAMFSGGICPLTYTILTETFTFQVRAILMGIVITYGWGLTAVLLRVYSPIADALGVYTPYIFFGIINICGICFTTFYLTETKGKTEEQILQDLTGAKKTDKSINC